MEFCGDIKMEIYMEEIIMYFYDDVYGSYVIFVWDEESFSIAFIGKLVVYVYDKKLAKWKRVFEKEDSFIVSAIGKLERLVRYPSGNVPDLVVYINDATTSVVPYKGEFEY